MSFDRNVFVNCPFDENYVRLLQPLLFTIIYLKFKPRIALERLDSGEARISKIISLITALPAYRSGASSDSKDGWGLFRLRGSRSMLRTCL